MLSTIGLGVPGRRLSLLRTLSRLIIGCWASSLVPFAPALVSVHFCSFRHSWFPVTTKLTSLCRKLSTPFRIVTYKTFNVTCTKSNFNFSWYTIDQINSTSTWHQFLYKQPMFTRPAQWFHLCISLPLLEELWSPKAGLLIVSLHCPGRRSSLVVFFSQDKVSLEGLSPLYTAGAAWSWCSKGAFNFKERHQDPP